MDQVIEAEREDAINKVKKVAIEIFTKPVVEVVKRDAVSIVMKVLIENIAT